MGRGCRGSCLARRHRSPASHPPRQPSTIHQPPSNLTSLGAQGLQVRSWRVLLRLMHGRRPARVFGVGLLGLAARARPRYRRSVAGPNQPAPPATHPPAPQAWQEALQLQPGAACGEGCRAQRGQPSLVRPWPLPLPAGGGCGRGGAGRGGQRARRLAAAAGPAAVAGATNSADRCWLPGPTTCRRSSCTCLRRAAAARVPCSTRRRLRRPPSRTPATCVQPRGGVGALHFGDGSGAGGRGQTPLPPCGWHASGPGASSALRPPRASSAGVRHLLRCAAGVGGALAGAHLRCAPRGAARRPRGPARGRLC